MTNDIINEWNDVSKIYKGYLNIITSTTPTTNLRIDQLLELEIVSEVEIATHYSSQKKKNNAVIGQSSNAIIKFDDTKDLYSTTNNDDDDLISYITDQLNNKLEVVPMTFESVEETDSADNDKFILFKFIGDIFRSNLVRNTSTGTFEGTLGVNITSETHHKIASAAPT